MTELVHLDVADGVATITLDSEHNRNALSRQLVTELGAHLEAAEADADAKVIVLRSAHRVFCSGADLSEAAEGSMQQGAATLIDLQRRLATSAKPVVVVLGGPVRAGGLGLVGAADIVLATRPVTFALTEVRLALAPAVISASLLPRLSPRAASELFLTGRKFDAAEAAEIGLVTRVVEDGELDAALQSVLADLSLGYPQGFRETKALLNHDLVERIDRLGDQLAEQSARLFGSDEAREAMLAFLSRKG
ncbi:enoyl-CoA hydratase-related protein [Aeromicrobium duanguangcaii]|uniref:Enoyl-CoA hydratase-related protein n=1 Tax=Aeromicrobium duanguangcaii TaxID=2968086 RepID=A0ABY5KEV9_9ACTN|nr:enoyl-CoA hydratase-related protein [Aeromicrobium duanguangcaii]MCD9154580.1 enoyl-CoA hydratase-related protein [Aeromicrobium duanguangcaii]MCL3838332.1 enoyl-CoA hydratase-related protein [Aeromicrobium duanguangcaii]UUI68364.1 enoyl-CoA hydratase-related protein [Aeromicrobium duanguangcaii]